MNQELQNIEDRIRQYESTNNVRSTSGGIDIQMQREGNIPSYPYDLTIDNIRDVFNNLYQGVRNREVRLRTISRLPDILKDKDLKVTISITEETDITKLIRELFNANPEA